MTQRDQQEFTVRVHHEEGSLWAEVLELPGVFAAGNTIDELTESLTEALHLVLDAPESSFEWDTPPTGPAFAEDRLLYACG